MSHPTFHFSEFKFQLRYPELMNRLGRTFLGVFSATWVGGTGQKTATCPKEGPGKCDLSEKGGFSAVMS